jgi:hypothetical protein
MVFDKEKFLAAITPAIAVRGVGLLNTQKEGLLQLLSFLEAHQDARWGTGLVRIRRTAYFLATVAHECTVKMRIGNKNFFAPSFHPVEEMGSISYLNRMYDTRVDLGNTPQHDGDGAKYAGDGYVQNTGKSNARKTGKRLAGTRIEFSDLTGDSKILAAFVRAGGSQRTPLIVDAELFVREHELLRIPKISYLDAADGFLGGRYTGHKIADYIDDDEYDTIHARLVINGITKKNFPKVKEIEAFCFKFEKALIAADFAGSDAGSEVVIAEAPEQSEGDGLPVDLPEGGQQEGQQPEARGLESNSSMTALIPHMDTAKSWLVKAFGGTFVGAAWAFYTNQPVEIRIGILALFGLLITAAIVVFVKYHKEVFEFVTNMYQTQAANPALSLIIQPDKKTK